MKKIQKKFTFVLFFIYICIHSHISQFFIFCFSEDLSYYLVSFLFSLHNSL